MCFVKYYSFWLFFFFFAFLFPQQNCYKTCSNLRCNLMNYLLWISLGMCFQVLLSYFEITERDRANQSCTSTWRALSGHQGAFPPSLTVSAPGSSQWGQSCDNETWPLLAGWQSGVNFLSCVTWPFHNHFFEGFKSLFLQCKLVGESNVQQIRVRSFHFLS